MRKFLAVFIISVMFLASCAWFGVNMRQVSIGMTRDQVMKAIGQPINVIDSKKVDSNLQETWEYPGGGDSKIWVYFKNGKVTNWKRTGLY